jgi:hypothetical protein
MGLITELVYWLGDKALDWAAGEGGQSEKDVIRTAARRNRLEEKARMRKEDMR